MVNGSSPATSLNSNPILPRPRTPPPAWRTPMPAFAIIVRGGYLLALVANIGLMVTVFRPIALWELPFCLFTLGINLVSVVGFWIGFGWSRNSESALSLGRIAAVVFVSA